MPIVYKIDIMAALKSAGYSAYRLRKEKIIGQAAITQIRQGKLPSWAVLGKICDLLGCQPGDLIARGEKADVRKT